MKGHATAEVLSAYLDAELGAGERQQLDRHLEECSDCRAELDSMRRVVSTLQRMERQAPPPILAQNVQRRIALSGESKSPFDRLEERLRRVPQASQLLMVFALVLSLAVILYLFSISVERAGRGPTALVVGHEREVPMPTGEVRESREAAGRAFDLIDGTWRERGLEEWTAAVWLDVDSAEIAELLELYPELGELEGRVVLRLDDQLVGLPAGR